jgi:hypothetical protein
MVQPTSINPQAIYDAGSLNLSLGLSRAAIDRARREGTLRHTKQGHRILYLGQWVLDWLTAESELTKAAEVAHA